MVNLTIVSGSPGAGKTTFSARYAKSLPRGLHIPSDIFYSFPANPMDPTQPESQSQNEAIMHALGSTSASFLQSEYDVVLDGIMGPWFLADLLAAIPEGISVDYLLFTIDEATAIERVRAREGKDLSERVRSTRRAFLESESFQEHVIELTGLSTNEVFERVCEEISAEAFRLSR